MLQVLAGEFPRARVPVAGAIQQMTAPCSVLRNTLILCRAALFADSQRNNNGRRYIIRRKMNSPLPDMS